MTTSPSQLNIEDAPVKAFPHGALSQYTTEELALSEEVERLDLSLTKNEREFRFAVVKTKLKLDGEDQNNGDTPGHGDHERSRFWSLALTGKMGDRCKQWAEVGNRVSVNSWVNANEAAKLFADSGVNHLTPVLPLSVAQEKGIKLSTLEIVSKMSPKAQSLAVVVYKNTGTLKADMAKECTRIVNSYPELIEEFEEGIRTQILRFPHDVQQRCKALDEQKAADRAAAAAAAQEQARLKAMKADELQDVADAKARTEAAAAVDAHTDRLPAALRPPTVSEVDGPTKRPTYPIQELIDGTAFEGLQKQYEDDSKEFLTDMRELYSALRTAKRLAEKWGDTMFNRYGTSSMGDMLLWETYSRVWTETGKFKKLGNVTHVADLYELFMGITKKINHGLHQAKSYARLTSRWGEVVECRTAEEQKQYQTVYKQS